MAQNRIVWIDWAKTFLIYLMVVGHFHPPLYQSQFFYVFHMPAFFVISGYLYKAHDWRKTLIALLTPIVLYSIFNFVFQFCINLLRFGQYDTSNLLERIFMPYIGWTPNPHLDYIILFMGAWFPEVLIAARLLLGDVKFLSWVGRYKEMVFIVLFLFLISLPYWMPSDSNFYQVKVLQVLSCLPFMIFGMYLKEHHDFFYGNQFKYYIPLIIAVYLFMEHWNGRVGILDWNFGHGYFFFFVGAISGSLTLFWICSKLFSNKFVETISIGTFLILGLHMDFYDILYPIMNHLGFSALVPSWVLPWVASLITLLLCYYPIRWTLKHCPVLLGKYK